MSVKITGTGSALPNYVLTNQTLSEMVDTTSEWIEERTGILERRILTEQTLTDIASSAALSALDSANVKASDIDMIICSTLHSEQSVPSLACMVQERIQATCAAFDINAACSGFLYGLNVAKALIDSNAAKKVLLIAAESLSQVTDYTDRSTCVLFGDGAGAVVLEKGEGILSIFTTAKGNSAVLNLPSSRGNFPFKKRTEVSQYLNMNGQEVYKFAVSAICEDVQKVLKNCNLLPGDIDFYLLHQANVRIIESAARKLKIPKEKLLKNIEKYGNTSAACIPIMLDEFLREGILKKGMRLLLSAFGGGLTTGAAIINLV